MFLLLHHIFQLGKCSYRMIECICVVLFYGKCLFQDFDRLLQFYGYGIKRYLSLARHWYLLV